MKIKNRNTLIVVSLMLYVVVLFNYNLGNSVMPVFLRSTNFGTEIFGYLTGSMYLGQFLIAPFWGKLSDTKGRWVLMFSPIGYGVGQLIYILSADSLFLLFFSRIFSGMFAILFLSQFVAYISDITPVAKRKNILSITAIMVPLGMGFAYLVGGLLKSNGVEQMLLHLRAFLSTFLPEAISTQLTLHYTFPFLVQFIFGWFLGILIFMLVSKNNQYQVKNKVAAAPKGSRLEQFFSIKKYVGTVVFSVILITFFNSLGYAATQSIQYYLQDALGQDPAGIGFIVFSYSILSVIISFIIQPILIKKNSDWKNLLIANGTVILMAILLNFSTPITLIIIMSIVILMNTLFISITQSILANTSDTERGLLIGMNQSSTSLGAIIGNFVISPLYGFMPAVMKYRLPFVMMALALLVVTIIIAGPLKKQLHIK